MEDRKMLDVEQTDGRARTYLQRSAGELPRSPLHSIMKWILEQLNLGHFEKLRDSQGDIVSMTIGRSSPRASSSGDEALEQGMSRLLAIDLN